MAIIQKSAILVNRRLHIAEHVNPGTIYSINDPRMRVVENRAQPVRA